jgi:V8-like Glu-specific endopeptidase
VSKATGAKGVDNWRKGRIGATGPFGARIQSVIPDGENARRNPPPPLPSMVAAVVSRTGGLRSRGTAFYIGDHCWLTAAHIFVGKDFEFTDASMCPQFDADDLHSRFDEVRPILHPEWQGDRSLVHDLAVIRSPASPAPDHAFELVEAPGGGHDGKAVNVMGYDGSNSWWGDLLWHVMPLVRCTAHALQYRSDTVKGQSGGPVILWPVAPDSASWRVIGVHSEGVGHPNTAASDVNVGAPITTATLAWINDQKRAT